MKRSKAVLIFFNILVTSVLMVVFALDQFWFAAVFAFGLGIWGWLGLRKSKWLWSKDLSLAGVVVLVTIGGLLSYNVYMLLIALTCGLVFWDLARFQQRMSHTSVNEKILSIEKKHLILLGIACSLGVILALITLNIELHLSFLFALSVAVFLIISLGQIYRQMRN